MTKELGVVDLYENDRDFTQILDSSLACTIVMIGTYLPQLSINESAASSKVCVDDVYTKPLT